MPCLRNKSMAENSRIAMNIALVSNQRQNAQGIGNPIMYRMRDSLVRDDRVSEVVFVPFDNSIKSLRNIRRAAKTADILHVHFGGLYAVIIWIFIIGTHARRFITFHGTDIHAKSIKTAKSIKKKIKIRLNQWASFLSILLFSKTGFVAKEMTDYVPGILSRVLKRKAFIQPLGVDYATFSPSSKEEAQKTLSLKTGHYVLFSDVSNTSIKRRDIAEAIVRHMGNDYRLLVMCGVKPQEVPCYINACDFLLLTSDEEGSPNIIRESLAMNKPVFSVQVGDAAIQLEGLRNSSIISRKPEEAAKVILEKISTKYSDNTRETRKSVLNFDEVNKSIVNLYSETL